LRRKFRWRALLGMAGALGCWGAAGAGIVPVGKDLFSVCESCHGIKAEGNRELNAPALAGMDVAYFSRQIDGFRRGWRGTGAAGTPGASMREMVALLESSDSVAAVAAYVNALPLVRVAPSLKGDPVRGAVIYKTCAACHGEQAQGQAVPGAPALQGQADWYLVRQLEDFRSGRRGAGPGDDLGAQMRAVAQTLKGSAPLRDVVAYIRTLGAATLSNRCPPSFEENAGRCEFRSLYELFELPQGHGGLRAPLPRARESFTARQIDLGRLLFFDPLLSADRRLACASCHQPGRSFADGRARSQGHLAGGGAEPTLLPRNAPSLWNVGFLPKLFWDARADSLEAQARGPLFAPEEMAATPQSLLAALNGNEEYRRLFALAFERSKQGSIAVEEVTRALAAFETSLVSFNSRYDRYAMGDSTAMTQQEIAGYNLFRGFVGRCSQCHVPPLFTSGDVAVVGAPPSPGQSYDAGVGALQPDPDMRGAFKVPTLRNVALTAPYFQAGQLASLEDVVAFYDDTRGHAVPPGEAVHVHWHVALKGPTFSAAERAALVAFLGALTDESMMPRIPERVPSGLPVPRASSPSAETSSLALIR
jgi:cytochrome c peroxidase